MTFDETLAKRIRHRLARRKNIEEKKMFGGVGFLLNDNLLVGVWKDSLCVRLGSDEGEEALKEPHVKKFDITGRPMKNGVLVEPEGIESDDLLSGWLQRAEKFSSTLPRKGRDNKMAKSQKPKDIDSYIASFPLTFRRYWRRCGQRSKALLPKRRRRSAT